MWGGKGDADLLCCSSVAGTYIELQATATVKNGKKGLNVTSSRRNMGQIFPVTAQLHGPIEKELIPEGHQL